MTGAGKQPGSASFIGRAAELELLRQGWERAAGGQGGLVLCAGEPGIGKTRTAEELAQHVSAQGGKVLWGRCYESEGAPAFWPWVQILRAAVRELGDQALEVAGGAAAELGQLVPELGVAALGTGTESPETRFRLFDSVGRVLEALATRAPRLVVLDDVHGADLSSLQLLQFVGQQVRHMGVMVVATYREAGVSAEHALPQALMEMQREAGTQRVELRGLSAAEVGQYVEVSLGAAAASPEMIAELHRQTEGNPLFVGEYVRVLGSEGARKLDAAAVQGMIPRGVKTVIGQRLAPLTAGCRRVLEVAAVVGREFGVEVVRRVVIGAALVIGTMGGGEACAGELAEAEAVGVVAPMLEPGRQRFAHALIRETLYEGLENKQRAQLHRWVGEALEQGEVAPEYLAELAYHFAVSGEAQDAAKAVTYARRGAERAHRLLAYEEAVRLNELALSLLDRYRDQLHSPYGERCAVLIALGEVQRDAGDLARSKQTMLEAAQHARQHDDRDLVARAALGYGTKNAWGESGAEDPVLITLLEDAVHMWGGDEGVVPAQLRARLAAALIFTTEVERRRTVSEEAVEMARRTNDLGVIAFAQWAWCGANWAPDNLEARLKVANEVIRNAERIGDRHLVFQGRIVRLNALFELADRPGVDSEICECERLTAVLREPFHRWYLSVVRSAVDLMEGRFEAASQRAQDASSTGQPSGEGTALVTVVQQFHADTTRWRIDALGAQYEIFDALAEQQPLTFGVETAMLAAMLDRRAQAQVHFEKFASQDFGNLVFNQNWPIKMRQLTLACAYLDDSRRAARLYELLLPYRARAITITGPIGFAGPVEHYLGLLAATQCRWDEAEAHFAAAVEVNGRMRAIPWLACSQIEYASALLQRGNSNDRKRTAELSETALAQFYALDMPGWVQRAQRVLAGLEERSASLDTSSDPSTSGESSAAEPLSTLDHCFRREGHFWTIRYAGSVLRLKDNKGLQYIAYLLRHPGQEFLALDLVGAISYAPNRPSSEHARATIQTQPLLDAQAKDAYVRRLDELRDELREADANNDLGRAAQLRSEAEALAVQLRSAVGLGGRDRTAGHDLERARSAVGKRIRGEIKRIRTANPALGRHLAATVTTGYFCSYRPDADAAVVWQL